MATAVAERHFPVSAGILFGLGLGGFCMSGRFQAAAPAYLPYSILPSSYIGYDDDDRRAR